MQPLRSSTPSVASRAQVVAHEIDIDPDWLDFGPDDPLEAGKWINRCMRCEREPALYFERQAHVVRCVCGATGTAGRLPSVAAINWNKSPASTHPDYRELPFFALHDLDIVDARAKLVCVRDYLVEQKRRCEQRIRAYLAWSIYALGLVKEAELAGSGGDAPTES